MLLFGILLVLGILLIILGIKAEKKKTSEDGPSILECFGIILMLIVIGMSIWFIINTVGADAKVAELNSQIEIYDREYEYLIEADSEYITYMDISQLFSNIRNHNASVAKKKALIDNIWIGMFYPKAYEDLETVDLDASLQE